MKVSLRPQREEFSRRDVESGIYNSASEVLREGLRLAVERDAMQGGRDSEDPEINRRVQGARMTEVNFMSTKFICNCNLAGREDLCVTPH